MSQLFSYLKCIFIGHDFETCTMKFERSKEIWKCESCTKCARAVCIRRVS